ncbi:hypothetical protein ACTU45_13630, partial [Streptomyces sp. 24-1644]
MAAASGDVQGLSFKYDNESRLTTQTDRLLALDEDLGCKGVRLMVSSEWGAPAHVNEVLSKSSPGACASGQLKAYHVPGNGMSGNEFMAAVIAMLEDLRGLAPLTAEGAAARFLAQEWTPGGK